MAGTLYRQLTALLKEAGCSYLRDGSGSHEIWQRKDGKPFTVATGISNRHMANAILKQAGLEKAF